MQRACEMWKHIVQSVNRFIACSLFQHSLGGFKDAVKNNKPMGCKAMIEKKERERVVAEITLSHLIRLGNEQGCPVSRQQALAFLNQQGRAFEMWKHMMQAAEDFIAGSLFPHSCSAGEHKEYVSRPGPSRSISTAAR